MSRADDKSEIRIPYPNTSTTAGEMLRLAVNGYRARDGIAVLPGKDGKFHHADMIAEDIAMVIDAMRSARRVHGSKFDEALSTLIALFDLDNNDRRMYKERDWRIRLQYFVFRKSQNEIAQQGIGGRKEREKDEGGITCNLSAQSVGDIIRSTSTLNRKVLESYIDELTVRLAWARKRSKADYSLFCEMWNLSEKQQERLKRFFQKRYNKTDRDLIVRRWAQLHDSDDLFKPGFDHHANDIEVYLRS